MAQNSFMLKGWAITIFVAVIALNVQTERFIHNLTLSIFPLAFWYIDAYYLYIERKYRKLYENRITLRKGGNSDNLYSLGIGKIKLINVLATMFSSSIAWFYIPILGILILALLI